MLGQKKSVCESSYRTAAILEKSYEYRTPSVRSARSEPPRRARQARACGSSHLSSPEPAAECDVRAAVSRPPRKRQEPCAAPAACMVACQELPLAIPALSATQVSRRQNSTAYRDLPASFVGRASSWLVRSSRAPREPLSGKLGKPDQAKGSPPACRFMYLYIASCLPACLSVCLSFCLSVCLSVCLPKAKCLVCLVCLSVCLFVCLSVCLSACLPLCLSVCQLACLRDLRDGFRVRQRCQLSMTRFSVGRSGETGHSAKQCWQPGRFRRTKHGGGSGGRGHGPSNRRG